jgi:hypothetical protein
LTVPAPPLAPACNTTEKKGNETPQLHSIEKEAKKGIYKEERAKAITGEVIIT